MLCIGRVGTGNVRLCQLLRTLISSVVVTVARGPSLTLCGQPAASPRGNRCSSLASGGHPTHPPIPAQPLPADISTIYCCRGFASSVVVFPAASLYARIHSSEYSGVVFYVVIGYRKYSPCCHPVLMGL
jgi:hypothetical protein